MAMKESIEKTIYNIRRKTRKKYTAEDKIRIVLDELGFFPFLGHRSPSAFYLLF